MNVVVFASLVGSARAWSTHPRIGSTPPSLAMIARRSSGRGLETLLRAEILDVDFERVDRSDKRIPSKVEMIPQLIDQKDGQPRSLLELAAESEPDQELQNTPIPFLDGENYIDTKLAFMAELDGIKYAIAMPFDYPVAMTLEKKDGSVDYLAADLEENDELLEIMAAQVKEHLGENLQLKRTPRILTISGPLDDYTKNWKTEILPRPVSTNELLDETDDDLDFFHNFMKEELGEEEYQKTLDEDCNDINEELLALFEIPGLGSNEDDEAGIEDLLKSMLESPLDQEKDMEAMLAKDTNHAGVALKLISYVFPDGKSYSLVQLLKPYALIGKVISGADDIRFELLSPEEEKILVPRLEQVCRDDLEKVGMVLQ